MGMTWTRLLLAVSVFALVGCSAEGPEAPPTPADTGADLAAILSGGLDERSGVPAPLRGTAWLLVSVERGAEAEDVEALASSLDFGVDGVSGKTCNSYGADVRTATSDRITTDGFFSTLMACGGPAAEIDRLVQALPQSGATWQRQDATLTLARGDVTLAFALRPA